MNDFIIFLLTKLGLGVNASIWTIEQIDHNLHLLFGEDFTTSIINPSTICINYNNKNIYINYTFKEGKVIKCIEYNIDNLNILKSEK